MKKIIIYLLNLVPYYLMYLIKPKKHVWVFGAWFGEKYFDNPKFLFEYVKANNAEIQAIWITKDREVCNNYDIIYKYSLAGYYYAMVGEIYIVSHSTFVDLYPFINNTTRKVVQLWHGIPVKKIGYDDTLGFGRGVIDQIKSAVFPFLKESYFLVIASSKNDQLNMSTAFRVDLDRVKITGYPRNDALIKVKNGGSRRVLYAPTLRGGINDNINLFTDFGFKVDDIVRLLEKFDLYLDIKMHPANNIDPTFKKSINNVRISILESKLEINEIMDRYEMLISDYSGIYVDYLLLNRPIIFTPFDLEEYLTRDREMYYDYKDITPGPKCKNWDQVFNWVVKFQRCPELYKNERNKLRGRFHEYQDGKNTERVFQEIIKLSV